MQLVSIRVNATTGAGVVIAVQALPLQRETTISTSGGRNCLGNPAFRVCRYLLIDPFLQTRFVSGSPVAAAQRLACEVALYVFLDLGHSLIVEVRANNLHTRCRKVLTIKITDSVVVETP